MARKDVKIPTSHEPEKARRVARAMGLLASGFMSAVSLLVFFTEDNLSIIDYFLILGAPPILGALFYYVGLYHDPKASD
jgi:hypothetical protein